MQEQDSRPSGKPRELSADEKAELRTGKAIRDLVQTEGWRVYKAILETHLAGKRAEYEAPVEAGPALDGVAQILRAESAKGAVMGLRLALSIPEGVLNNDKILRRQVGLAQGEEDDD